MSEKSLGNIFVLGDSYSAHSDFIPSGHRFYYSPQSERENAHIEVEEMWWSRLAEITGSKIILAAGASGSAISYTGWQGDSAEYSFIARFERFVKEGFFNKNEIDTFILFGGTNDHWIPSPLGEIKHGNITEEDKRFVLPAICYLLNRIKEVLPDARVLILENDAVTGPIIEAFDTEAARHGFEVIKLINIQKELGHPNREGMHEIAEQICEYIKEN